MKKTIAILLAAVLSAALFAGCAPEEKPAPSSSEAPSSSAPASSEEPKIETMDVVKFTDDFFAEIDGKLPFPSQMPIGDEELKNLYTLDNTTVASYSVLTPLMITQASEIAVFEAKTEEDVEAIKKGIEARVESLSSTWESYLRDQYEIVQASKIVTHGKYVLFACTEYNDLIINRFERAFDPSVEEMVIKAVTDRISGVVKEVKEDGTLIVTANFADKDIDFTVAVTEDTYSEFEGEIAVGTKIDVNFGEMFTEGDEPNVSATYLAPAYVEEEESQESSAE